MEHTNMREAMSRWYAMWGNQLDIKRVEDRKECRTASSGDHIQTEEQKVVELEKACCEEKASSVPELNHPEQTSSSGQHDDLGGPNCLLGLSR
jgi:hypothetical protein